MDDETQISNRNYEPIQKTEEDLCRALWLAVAVQGLIDASGKGGNSIDQARAQRWLVGRGGITGDFATVCDLAGIDPERTKKRFDKILRGDVEQIDFRCMKKAFLKNRSEESRKRFFRRAEKNARLRRERNSSMKDSVSAEIKPLRAHPQDKVESLNQTDSNTRQTA
ncbi:MAG: hypothetical protein V4689_12730 [Verrucomicrobiota bacterium]